MQPARANVVLPTAPVLAWQNSPEGIPVYDRFEFSRNDALVNAVTRVPLNATRQWPEPLPPREQHVRFWYWEQQ